MYVSLRDTANRVAEHDGEGQFQKILIADNARKFVAQGVGCNIHQLGLGPKKVEYAHYADEMSLPQFAEKKKKDGMMAIKRCN